MTDPSLERCQRQVEGMKAIGSVLGSGLELDLLLPRLIQETTRLLDAQRSTLFLVDADRGELYSKVLEGFTRTIRLPFGRGLAGWVAETGQPLRIRDAYADPRFDPSTDRQSGFRTRSVLAAPVRRFDGSLSAVVQVLNGRKPFDEGDEALLGAIAGQVGVLLEAAGLYQTLLDRNRSLARAHRELSLLFEVETILGDGNPTPVTLKRLMTTAVKGLSVRAGVVWVRRGGRLVVEAASNPALLRLRKPGPAERCLRDRCTYIGRPESPMKRLGRSVSSLLLVPIQDESGGPPLGVLELVDRQEKGPFDHQDLNTMATVAARIGRAISREAEREQRIREERLAAAGQALSGVVHDLRGPLTLIRGATQLQEVDAIGPEEAAERIRRQVDRIDGMSRELLAFVRGEQTREWEEVPLHAFVRTMDKTMSAIFTDTEIESSVQGKLQGKARMDPGRLSRVFENLARNSREALGRTGAFRVRFWMTEGGWGADVEDDGPGVPEDLADQVFEPFRTAGKSAGTGLGLAMARQVVEEHGGSLMLMPSNPRWPGARFRLHMPLEPKG